MPLLKQEQEEKELAKQKAEQERKEKEQAKMSAEQAEKKKGQAQKKAEQERKEKIALIASFQRMIDAGVSKELIAQANQMSLEALERLLEETL